MILFGAKDKKYHRSIIVLARASKQNYDTSMILFGFKSNLKPKKYHRSIIVLGRKGEQNYDTSMILFGFTGAVKTKSIIEVS